MAIAEGSVQKVLSAADHVVASKDCEITRTVGWAHGAFDPACPPDIQPGKPDNAMIAEMVGAYLYLCRHSKAHWHYQAGLIENRLLPSLEWDSYRLYFHDDIPVAFVNWTWLGDEVDRRLLNGDSALYASDWHQGGNLWFMEVLAPFGHGLDMMLDLHENVFTVYPDAKATYLDEQGELRALRHFRSPSR